MSLAFLLHFDKHPRVPPFPPDWWLVPLFVFPILALTSCTHWLLTNASGLRKWGLFLLN